MPCDRGSQKLIAMRYRVISLGPSSFASFGEAHPIGCYSLGKF
jgi:hypothetical protein